MRYILDRNITFGEVGAHLVFLDLAKDRYFRLEKKIETSLRSYLTNGDPLPQDLSDLVAAGVLVEKGERAPPVALTIATPCRSALESEAHTGQMPTSSKMLETMVIVPWMHRKLRKSGIKSCIDGEVAYRTKRTRATVLSCI